MKEMGYNKLKQSELLLDRSKEKAVEKGSKRRGQKEAKSIILKPSIRLEILLLQI